jgi:hypothetical protein
MSVYGVVIDCILYLFCMDLEIEEHFGKHEA